MAALNCNRLIRSASGTPSLLMGQGLIKTHKCTRQFIEVRTQQMGHTTLCDPVKPYRQTDKLWQALPPTAHSVSRGRRAAPSLQRPCERRIESGCRHTVSRVRCFLSKASMLSQSKMVGCAVLGEISVFDRTNADSLADRGQFFRSQIRFFSETRRVALSTASSSKSTNLTVPPCGF